MKQSIVIGKKLAVGAALSLMLGAASTAQRAGSTPSLQLDVRLMGNDDIDPHAVIPLAMDLSKVLKLSGGAPGSMAIIEIGHVSGRRGQSFSRCAVFTGPFGPTGQFEVVLPPVVDVRGFGARGAQAPDRMVTVAIDLDEAVEEAFVTWENLGSLPKPQGGFSAGGRSLARGPGRLGQAQDPDVMLTHELDQSGNAPTGAATETSWEILGRLPKPQGGFSAGGRSLARGPGRLGQAQDPDVMVTVEIDESGDAPTGAATETSWEILGRLPKPQGGFSAGGRSLSRGPGRLGQAQDPDEMVAVELDQSGDEPTEAATETSWENLGSLPKPQGGFSAGGRSLSRGPGRLGQAQDPDTMVVEAVDNATDVTGPVGNSTSWQKLGSL